MQLVHPTTVIYTTVCMLERHRSRVVRATWLWCGKLPEGRELEAGLCQPTTLSVNPVVIWYFFFTSGKDNATRVE